MIKIPSFQLQAISYKLETMRRIVLVVHDVRSAHNVGSLLRTADGLGVETVYFSGYTPYPEAPDDSRLPHIRTRISNQIHKTALGAEDALSWKHEADPVNLLGRLRKDGYSIVALEQTLDSQTLADYRPNANVVLLVGNEVTGLDAEMLKKIDLCLEIPMLGRKESFNVSVAAAIALYHLRYGT
jgi:tRNA G18 (ribose-2'-O)-methylase SpoU